MIEAIKESRIPQGIKNVRQKVLNVACKYLDAGERVRVLTEMGFDVKRIKMGGIKTGEVKYFKAHDKYCIQVSYKKDQRGYTDAISIKSKDVEKYVNV